MKKILLLFSVLALGVNASAQDYNYLTWKKTSGAEKSLKLDGLKIAFDATSMFSENSVEKDTVALGELQMLFFSVEPTGVQRVEREGLLIEGGERLLSVTAAAGSNVSVYDATGALVGKYRADGSTRSLTVGRGVFLVNCNGETQKVLVK